MEAIFRQPKSGVKNAELPELFAYSDEFYVNTDYFLEKVENFGCTPTLFSKKCRTPVENPLLRAKNDELQP
jgi:hypothetical protein